MIAMTNQEMQRAGGFLAALTDKAAEYLHGIFVPTLRPQPHAAVERLERTIVHTAPHLDEYFAELLFRSCLGANKWGCDIIEQSIFSASDDLGCKHLWPSAAVLGIGSTA